MSKESKKVTKALQNFKNLNDYSTEIDILCSQEEYFEKKYEKYLIVLNKIKNICNDYMNKERYLDSEIIKIKNIIGDLDEKRTN